MLQSTTTSGELDMWKNVYIPRADLPPLIEPGPTAGQLDMWQNADVPNRKSYIFCSCLQNTFIMQDQESRQPPPETQIMVQQASDANHLCSPI